MFEDVFPMFLMIGMSNEDYWWGDNSLPKAYLKADELRRKRENENAWRQGAYIYEALCDVAPALQAFNKKPKVTPYLKCPVPLNKKELEEQQEREQAERYEKMRQFMKARTENG